MIYKLDYILNDIHNHLISKKPFSLVRFGDGCIKWYAEASRGKMSRSLLKKAAAQGNIPSKEILKFHERWIEPARESNYIDSFEPYFSDNFWDRKFSDSTKKRVQLFEKWYEEMGLHSNYCNPEIPHLMFLNRKRNLFDIMKDYRICLITAFKKAKRKLSAEFDVGHIIIPGRGGDLFHKTEKIKNVIIESSSNYDLYLVGAGAYSFELVHTARKCGKVALSIGQVFDSWALNRNPERIKGWIEMRGDLRFELTKKAKRFSKHL